MSEHGCSGCPSKSESCCGSSKGACPSKTESCCGSSPSKSGGCCGRPQEPQELPITLEEELFLQKLAQCPFLPIGQFLLESTKGQETLCLAPVFLETGKESLEEIKEQAQIILSLEEKDLISLDYDSPLQGADPLLFLQSHAMDLLQQTVEAGKEDFCYDPPKVLHGSVCLTPLGEVVIEQLDFI